MLTNFAALTSEQKTVWSRDMWHQARNMSFVNQFLGTGPNSLIQHVTELKKTEKGARAVLTLLTDMEGDGVAGDRQLEGNEEAGKSFDLVIKIDQLRNAQRHEGRMADQKTVVNFRENARDTLAYWLSDRIDQLAFLSLAGINYSVKNAGGMRIGSDLPFLEFAADVAAPTTKRFGRWDGASNKVISWGTGSSSIAAADTPTYAMLVQAKAYAKDNYIRGIKEKGGEETYHVFFSPQAMAKLKLDPDYLSNVRWARQRGEDNPLFTGDVVKLDGLYLHEFRHVPNTRLATPGNKFGASGTVEGCQVLFCGAQALGMADLGAPTWEEKGFDYQNSQGISTGKIIGFRKPQFYTQYSGGTTEDFGVLSIYVAQ
jgi:N4-gp56 family major capsid protein